MNYHACFNQDRSGKGKMIAEDVCIRKWACDWLRDGECKFVPRSARIVKKYKKKLEKKRK